MSKSPIERICAEFDKYFAWVESSGNDSTPVKLKAYKDFLRTALESYRTEIREERDREILGTLPKPYGPIDAKSDFNKLFDVGFNKALSEIRAIITSKK